MLAYFVLKVSFIQLKRVRQSWGEQGVVMKGRGVEPSALLQGGIEGLGVTGIILCCFDFSETRLLWAGQP